MLVALIAVIVLMIRNCVFEKSIWRVLASIACPVGGAIILCYFTILGRALMRVWIPVLLAAMASEIIIMIKGRPRWRGVPHFLMLMIMLLGTFYGAGQIIDHAELKTPQLALTARVNGDDSAYESTLKGSELYLWPNWHGALPEYYETTGKLPSKEVMRHNVAVGDWTYGQPYFNDFLAEIGHANPMADLVEGRDVYIMTDSETVMNYIHHYYGYDIELEAVRKIRGETAYRALRKTSDVSE